MAAHTVKVGRALRSNFVSSFCKTGLLTESVLNLGLLRICSRSAGAFRQRADEMKDGKIPEEEFEELSEVEILYDIKLPKKRERPEREPLPCQNTRRWFAKKYAKEGKSSGVDPSIIWPTKKELEFLKQEERDWVPSLAEMQAEIKAREDAIKKHHELRQKKIDIAMAKMPELEAELARKEEEKEELDRKRAAKRAKLLEMAREKLGYAVDPRSKLFQNIIAEAEEEERKKKKALKKKGIKI